MKSNSFSRRNFFEKTAATAGLTAFGALGISDSADALNINPGKLPREAWIATVSQHELTADNADQMTKMVLSILENSLTYNPDFICLPEVFATNCLKNSVKTLSEKLEVSGKVLKTFSAFAKKNRCYVICPVYTTENGKVYNSGVVLDRQGEQMGEYRKIHITEGEIKSGISPGSLDPPVFKTDFGIIGVQICFDMLWEDGWNALSRKGVEIIFWPSAYAGGQEVNAKAWQNKCAVVSSTKKNTTKICDISGNTIAQTGIWDNNLICAPVNLEKAFLHSWPSIKRFDAIRAKYGRKIRITNHHEEEWSIIESLSPEVLVKDILKEFNLKTHRQHKLDSETAQNKARGSV